MELDLKFFYFLVVFADEWADLVPDLHIFLFDSLFGSSLIIEAPFFLSEDLVLEYLPF